MLGSSLILASEAPNGQFIPGDAKELYFGAAAFAIVFVLLAWKLWPIINKWLAGKGESIKAELAAAEQAQAAADAEVAELRARLGDADADARQLVAAAKGQAETIKTDLAAKALADAAEIRSKGVADIASLRSQVMADVQAEVGRNAVDAAEEVVRTSLDEATHNQLIDQYIDQVGSFS